MPTKQELEQQLSDAIAVAQRLGDENKQLKEEVEVLQVENIQLKNDFSSAVERVRYLDEQIKMLESQRVAQTRFSDSERDY